VNSSATTTTRPIAPSYPLISADIAAHRAASYVRPTPARAAWGTCPECNAATGSGPHVCKPKAVPSTLRLETDLAYLLKDRQVADAARREIAEYAGVAA
jgi:hypothetical protein